jgi:hypothetical protein
VITWLTFAGLALVVGYPRAAGVFVCMAAAAAFNP